MNAKSISIGLTLWAGLVSAQTVINGGRTVKGAWDASGAASTKPAKAGTPVPAACSSGELFFNTAAAAGQNLYLCQPDNTWTQLTASGGGGGINGSGAANQMAFFSGTGTVASDSAITRDSQGNLKLTAGELVVGPDVTSNIGGYTIGVGMRLYFRGRDEKTCAGGTVGLSGAFSVHRVDLNNQSSCAISWGESNANAVATVLLCQGDMTATTTLVWPEGVKGGMAATGGTNTCMAQNFVFDGTKAAWYATGPGIGGM